MPVLLTIGYGNTKPVDFKEKILTATVAKWVVDVRGKDGARISTYRPGKNMEQFLKPEIGYVWLKELGNPFIPKKGALLVERHKTILQYRDWLLTGDGLGAFCRLQDRLLFLTSPNVLLLCCEGKAVIDGYYNCHRAILAEELCEQLNRQTADLNNPQWYSPRWKVYHL